MTPPNFCVGGGSPDCDGWFCQDGNCPCVCHCSDPVDVTRVESQIREYIHGCTPSCWKET